MKHTIVVIYSFLVFGSLFSQTKLIKSIDIDTPQEIINCLGDIIIKTSTIDFDGDFVKDYIVTVEAGSKEEPLTREFWFKSNFELFKKIDLYTMDYDFKFFIHIDNDPEPEIFRATGYSDGIDYYFADQNLKARNESILFYFSPFIKKTGHSNSYYWGYPWTLQSIFLNWSKEGMEINCSLNHEIIRDAEIHIPDDQSVFPIILFDGNPKSDFDYADKIDSIQWLTINEIIRQLNK